MKKKLQDFLTLKEPQRFALNRSLLFLSVILYVTSSLIANYGTTVNEAWWRFKFILMFDFMLILFALRKEVIKLVSIYGYRIMLYSLINYFIDSYFGEKGWSWNDFLTIALILLEVLILKFRKK